MENKRKNKEWSVVLQNNKIKWSKKIHKEWIDYIKNIWEKVEMKVDFAVCKIYNKDFFSIKRSDFWNRAFSLDSDNSNFCYVWDKYRILKTRAWKDSVFLVDMIVDCVSIPILNIVLFWKNKFCNQKSLWKFTMYWSFFRLWEKWRCNFVDVFQELWFDLLLLNELKVDKRIDIAFDVYGLKNILNIEKIIDKKNLNLTKFDWKRDYCDYKGTFATSGIWYWYDKRGLKDRTMFLRIYDKILDTEKKEKYLLYWDYVEYQKATWKKIYRVEFELWDRFCVLNNEWLIDFLNGLENGTDWDTMKRVKQYLCLSERDENVRFSKKSETTIFSSYSESMKIQYIRATVSRKETIDGSGLNLLLYQMKMSKDRKLFYEKSLKDTLEVLKDTSSERKLNHISEISKIEKEYLIEIRKMIDWMIDGSEKNDEKS